MTTAARRDDIESIDDGSLPARPEVAAMARARIEAKLARGERVLATDGFGLWADRPVDGLKYQGWVRGE